MRCPAAGPVHEKAPVAGGFVLLPKTPANYMRAIIASPKAEQDTSWAPSIRRAKS
jgi:hypothetical protein